MVRVIALSVLRGDSRVIQKRLVVAHERVGIGKDVPLHDLAQLLGHEGQAELPYQINKDFPCYLTRALWVLRVKESHNIQTSPDESTYHVIAVMEHLLASAFAVL